MKLFRGEIELKGIYKFLIEKDNFEVRDEKGNIIYLEDNDGCWEKWQHDKNDNTIYYENYYGCWSKYEYDNNGNITYYEDSEGKIGDDRPKVELTLKEIADKFEVDLTRLRIKYE